MVACYIGLGSNLGDSISFLNSALQDLRDLQQTSLISHSSFYETRPVGPVEQANFINAVALLDSQLSPARLLSELQQIENRHNRIREGERWGPRTLDLDILLYGDLEIAEKDLIVPHKEISNRAFVLVPLLELDAKLSIPGFGQVASLLTAVDQSGVHKMTLYDE